MNFNAPVLSLILLFSSILSFESSMIRGENADLINQSMTRTSTEPDIKSINRRFARLALSCLHREYPNKLSHVLVSDEDVKPARSLTPVFFGCFDWHSAVHGHWLLVRLARIDEDLREECSSALDLSFSKDKLLAEARFLQEKHRQTFERPYGLAWLLQLVMELDQWTFDDNRAELRKKIVEWREYVRPLETIVVQRLSTWLPKLSKPVRSGEHSQTAFALGLSLDYARHVDNKELVELIEEKTLSFFSLDENYPFNYEPSGEDFLSAGLAEADLLRRLSKEKVDDFDGWFSRLIPEEKILRHLEPSSIEDPTDPKLIHHAGLFLSRAWMIEGILQRLSTESRLHAVLTALAKRNAQSGLMAIDEQEYGGAHWLGTFAVYLLTKRGINSDLDQDYRKIDQ